MTLGYEAAGVWLYWVPLGAGARSVRLNGVVYEWISAALHGRARCDLFHSALRIAVPSGNYMVEMTPVPDGDGARRGVVAVGPVAFHWAGRSRLLRYEVRRWRDGEVPDLHYAVGAPIELTRDPALAQAVFDALPHVPRLTWGRDERRRGEMWTCNSIISWALTTAGVDADAIPMPPGARAPGWRAGAAEARARRPQASGATGAHA